MYLEYFGLSEFPFTTASDPRYFYPTARHREALACLLYTVEQRRGLALITGEIGAGKTMLCRAALERFDPAVQPIFLVHSSLSPLEFIHAVSAEADVETAGRTKVELLRGLRDTLVARHRHGGTAVLLLDEAQGLADDVLEEVRLLTNLETGADKLLQIVLVGQPELRRRIAGGGLRALDQRIAVKFHLGSLSRDEVAQYVDHRLRVAGAAEAAAVFAPEAKAPVFEASAGVPRVINIICDQAMLDAYGRGQEQVTSDIVRRVVREMEGYYMIEGAASGSVEPTAAVEGPQQEGRGAMQPAVGGFRARASRGPALPLPDAQKAAPPPAAAPAPAVIPRKRKETPAPAIEAAEAAPTHAATVEELCARIRGGDLRVAFRECTDDDTFAAYGLDGLEVRVQLARVEGENYVVLIGDTGVGQEHDTFQALADVAAALGYVHVADNGYLRSSGDHPRTLELSGRRLGMACRADREATAEAVARHIRDLHEDMSRMLEAAAHPERFRPAPPSTRSDARPRRTAAQDGRGNRLSRLECPYCGTTIGVYADEVGTRGTCPGCSAVIEVSADVFGPASSPGAPEWARRDLR